MSREHSFIFSFDCPERIIGTSAHASAAQLIRNGLTPISFDVPNTRHSFSDFFGELGWRRYSQINPNGAQIVESLCSRYEADLQRRFGAGARPLLGEFWAKIAEKDEREFVRYLYAVNLIGDNVAAAVHYLQHSIYPEPWSSWVFSERSFVPSYRTRDSVSAPLLSGRPDTLIIGVQGDAENREELTESILALSQYPHSFQNAQALRRRRLSLEMTLLAEAFTEGWGVSAHIIDLKNHLTIGSEGQQASSETTHQLALMAACLMRTLSSYDNRILNPVHFHRIIDTLCFTILHVDFPCVGSLGDSALERRRVLEVDTPGVIDYESGFIECARKDFPVRVEPVLARDLRSKIAHLLRVEA